MGNVKAFCAIFTPCRAEASGLSVVLLCSSLFHRFLNCPTQDCGFKAELKVCPSRVL